jgi:ABC-type polysaccharide/polyol phosphate export permease
MSDVAQLRQLTWTRLMLFLREPEAIFWVFLFPIILALVLGLAFRSRGVERLPVAVVEGELDPRWEAALDTVDALEVVRFPDRETAERKLRSGAVAVLVEGGEPVDIRYDPTRPEGETARLRVDDALQRAAGRSDPLPVVGEPVTEHGSRYIDFLLPGILGMNLMGTGIWGTGFAIVDMRQKKLLKRMIVTPMRRTNFLLAQILSRFIFLVLEVAVIIVFGILILGVPFLGSWWLFVLLCALGAFCFAGLGLLIASRAQTLEGVSGLMNFAMVPMWLLSGVFFSYENFPDLLHPVIRLIPLTALNDGLRDLMLEGEGMRAMMPEVLVLLGWTVATFFLALRLFRWK